eukprot:1742601-Ditylum_brightwellii.AAC.1
MKQQATVQTMGDRPLTWRLESIQSRSILPRSKSVQGQSSSKVETINQIQAIPGGTSIINTHTIN